MGKGSGKTWDGNAMTQQDMMKKDTVLVIDDEDNVIGSASKRASHEFTAQEPRGILHRAFSVFLFDESTGELLLQQRASTKITFSKVRTPICLFLLLLRVVFACQHSIMTAVCFVSILITKYYTTSYSQVWTNTCCSHPLHGMEPAEVDTPAAVADGSVLGAKYAAIRKLDHELGIPANELPVEKFKFLTRLHYWAADTVTHGKKRYAISNTYMSQGRTALTEKRLSTT